LNYLRIYFHKNKLKNTPNTFRIDFLFLTEYKKKRNIISFTTINSFRTYSTNEAYLISAGKTLFCNEIKNINIGGQTNSNNQ